MSRKKSSYAAKHSEVIADNSVMSNEFVRNNPDLWEVLRNPAEFENNFLKLSYSRQIAMVDFFKDVMYENIVISPAKIKKMFMNLTYDNLETIHMMTGSFYEEGNVYFPISEDEKKLVRMECYGTIDARREHELSPCYKFFCKKENRGKYKLKDYALETSPMWRVFKQFESFRRVESSVRRHLYQQGINPDALRVMSVNDFCDVIHQIYAESPSAMKAHFLETGYKNRFVMNFMRACGKDLANHLLKRGIDERKVASLCRMMRKYGRCEVDSLVVTETHYTQRILDDLEARRYDVSALKVGDPITEEMTERLFNNDQEHLLLARDENGRPLSKDDLPRYEVHHKNAVKFANDGDYLAKVNYNSNLMLVEREMHRAYYHGFDNIVQVAKNNERYFSRVNTPAPNMCLIDGFNDETDIFFYDLEANSAAQKRMQEDKKYVVNYYERQIERLNHIPEIATRYQIEYSKNDLSNEHKNLQKLLQVKISVPAEDIKTIEEWFAPQKTSIKVRATQNNIVPSREKGGNEL
ncbi:MAG: hypothetical protein IKN71_00280 [Alphaproteobacteria bacterium]|nr:hypothetical protein [Alphaproteobacteria bacterium]